MAIITFPALTPTEAEFGQFSNTQDFTSPLVGTTQTLELPGAHWSLRARFDNLALAQRRLMTSFMVQLRGTGGRFFYGDPDFLIDGPQGVATGTPLVNGASQTGNSLITDGWSSSITDIMKAGDYFHFTNSAGGRALHMVVADVNSDGGGNATLTIEPAIRVSPSTNAALTVAGAKCQMRLINNDQTRWALSRPLFGSFGFEAVESFIDAA